MEKKRIFVSATTRDLKSYRELASQSLRKRGYDVDDQAIFSLTNKEIHTKLKDRITRCDAGCLPDRLLLRRRAITMPARPVPAIVHPVGVSSRPRAR